MEIWKDIKGYEGLYQISNKGRVKSFCKNKEGNILRKRKDKIGYLQVVLTKNKIEKSYKIHRLVAQAFIDNPLNKETVNHKDENKENNNVENLEWMTQAENNRYGTRTKRTQKPIFAIKNTSGLLLEFDGARPAGKFGFYFGNINNCLKGRSKTHKGFRWFYQ